MSLKRLHGHTADTLKRAVPLLHSSKPLSSSSRLVMISEITTTAQFRKDV